MEALVIGRSKGEMMQRLNFEELAGRTNGCLAIDLYGGIWVSISCVRR